MNTAVYTPIRLLQPTRSGMDVLPSGAVVDALPELADELIGRGLAEATDSRERYPNHPILTVVHEAPIEGLPTPGTVVYPPDHDAPTDIYGRKPDMTPRRIEAPPMPSAPPPDTRNLANVREGFVDVPTPPPSPKLPPVGNPPPSEKPKP